MNDFKETVKALDQKLCTDKNFDIIKKEIIIAGRNAVLYFIDGFIKDDIYEKLLEFLFKIKQEELKSIKDMKTFSKDKMPYVETSVCFEKDEIITAVLSGPSVLLIEGINGALIVDTRTYPARSIEEPRKDRSLRGSREAFSETFVTNTALIRRRIRNSNLRMEYMQIGKSTKLDIAVCYIDGKADKKILKVLKEKLKHIEIDGISMTQQALSEKLLKTAFFNPFPKFKFTERPDYASACILDGRIAVVMDNSPNVMLIPVCINDFFRETDDYYFLSVTGSYIRTLRVLISIVTVFITPLYLLLFNNEKFIPEFISFMFKNVSGDIPLFAQFLILEFLVDGLRLASVNTPDPLSNSLGIIGGLLISEFAVNAGWFSVQAILFTAFITVSSYALPNFEMAYAIKFERILLLIFTEISGFWGFLGVSVFFLISMLNIKTLTGKNYLYPIIPFNAKAFLELFIRFPIK